MPKICSLDFETRSLVNLKESGAYVYARHPSTQVLCACYSIDGGPVMSWGAWAGAPMPRDLKAALLDPACEMHAWNAQFERLITQHVLRVNVTLERWLCTAAWARSCGLPGKLESALEFIGEAKQLASKRAGHRIMLRWCQPLPEGGWAEDLGEYQSLIDYCGDDVRSEQRLQDYLRPTPMSEAEVADFNLCERINDRGLPIDVELSLAAQVYGETERKELDEALAALTDGEVTTSGQHARIKTWLARTMGEPAFLRFFEQRYEKHGKEVVKISTDKRARAEFLLSSEATEYPMAMALVEFVDDASKSSVSKFKVMAARAVDTGRAEGSYLTFGAVQTKRYSSRGVQAHNFGRAVPEDVPAAVQAVLERRVEGKVMHVLASLLRPAIKAPEGSVLVWGDWSSVEARGMPWLAGCEWKLDLYRQGVDVYRVNAQDIFGVEPEEATDGQRQIGKVSELSLQFGGAVGALKAMARSYGIGLDDAEALTIVTAWRKANQWAPQFSYALMRAYERAVYDGGIHWVGGISYEAVRNDTYARTVVCRLPGGTRLYYPGNSGNRWEGGGYVAGIKVKGTQVTYYRLTRDEIRRSLAQPGGPIHKDVKAKEKEDGTSFLKAGAAHFRTERVWHGLLAENVTQAICAALLRDCLRRVDAALEKAKLKASVIGHTHDEIVLESHERDAAKAAKVLHREMVRVPKWLHDFPLAAEIKTAPRYGK